MEDSLEDTITARCWLGHLARMEDDSVLFGWLPQPRPPHGTKMRWRDRVRKNLNKFDIDERTWHMEAQERDKWRQIWQRGLEKITKSRLQEDEQRSTTRRAARVRNSLLMAMSPSCPLPATHATSPSVKAKTLPATNATPHAQSTPHRDHLTNIS